MRKHPPASAIQIRPTKLTWLPAILVALAVVLLAGLTQSAADAESGFFASLYGDNNARRVGDILHLLIVEKTTASVKTDQEVQQQTSSQVGPGIGALSFIPLAGFSGQLDHGVNGSASHTGKVTSRMTVRVTETTKAGNLVIEGKRIVTFNRNMERIRITGEVRPEDVNPNNTIYSYDLANVELDVAGPNPRKPRHKVGIITRVLSWLF